MAAGVCGGVVGRVGGGVYCTAIVSADLDRTDNRFLGSAVLKGCETGERNL